ncbi:MAG: hypothetical protein NUW37_16315 [Planctomycetes bacterium]|nr:hypothetical protein [Planctomycetota bacterium]
MAQTRRSSREAREEGSSGSRRRRRKEEEEVQEEEAPRKSRRRSSRVEEEEEEEEESPRSRKSGSSSRSSGGSSGKRSSRRSIVPVENNTTRNVALIVIGLVLAVVGILILTLRGGGEPNEAPPPVDDGSGDYNAKWQAANKLYNDAERIFRDAMGKKDSDEGSYKTLLKESYTKLTEASQILADVQAHAVKNNRQSAVGGTFDSLGMKINTLSTTIRKEPVAGELNLPRIQSVTMEEDDFDWDAPVTGN